MALPKPETGLVISYSYLWRHEYTSGLREGIKNRPCVIVLHDCPHGDGNLRVFVAPITHTPPVDLTTAIEIPFRVKQYLGLDAEKSWVILDDFNAFTWPGFDLRPIPGKPGKYDYGILPPAFFTQVIQRIAALRHEGRKFVSSSRDDAL